MAFFDIDKTVEPPKSSIPSMGRQARYPWRDMEVGDSILADGNSTSTRECLAYNAATQWGRKNGIKFTGRAVGDGKVRIWRIE